MRLKPLYLYLLGIVIQVILLILVLQYPKAELQPGGEEWAIYLMMIFLIFIILISLVILIFSKLKTPRIASVVLGLVIGAMIVVFAQSIPGVSGIVLLIGGIVNGGLYISAGIMAMREKS